MGRYWLTVWACGTFSREWMAPFNSCCGQKPVSSTFSNNWSSCRCSSSGKASMSWRVTVSRPEAALLFLARMAAFPTVQRDWLNLHGVSCEQVTSQWQQFVPMIIREVAMAIPPFLPLGNESFMDVTQLPFQFHQFISRTQCMWARKPNLILFNVDDVQGSQPCLQHTGFNYEIGIQDNDWPFNTNIFTHRDFYTQTLLHTTHTLSHTEAFTHRRFYTEAFTHRDFYNEITEAFTHRRFYTQTLLHTNAFTHRSFHTQKLLHTNIFTHRNQTGEIAILPQFLAIKPHFVRKGCARTREIAILPQFLAIEPHFVWKGSPDALQLAILLQFLAIEPHFVRKGCARTREIAILPQFLAIEPHFVWKGCAGRLATRNFTSVFGDRTSFRAKGSHPDKRNRNFTPVFGDRTRFVQKGCDAKPEIAILLQAWAIEPRFVRKGCVSCRLVGIALRLQERKRKEGESKRAREQEGERGAMPSVSECEDVRMWRCEDEKMRRWEDEKMRRCEDEKMWRCEDVKMRRCESWADEKMRRCEDVRMWRWEAVKMWRWEDVKIVRCYVKMWICENVWQTPTIRRTLRSDALGKKNRAPRNCHISPTCMSHEQTSGKWNFKIFVRAIARPCHNSLKDSFSAFASGLSSDFVFVLDPECSKPSVSPVCSVYWLVKNWIPRGLWQSPIYIYIIYIG